MAALNTCPTCGTTVRGNDQRNQVAHYERDMPAVLRLPCGHVHVLESGSWGAIGSSAAATSNTQFIHKMKGLGLL